MRRFFLALTTFTLALAAVAHADNSPPPSIAPFAGPGGAIRPIAAPGMRFVYTLSNHSLKVFRRNADGTIGDVALNTQSLSNIFQPVIAKLNATSIFPASANIPKCPAAYANAAATAAAAADPNAVACIDNVYDSDVMYDPQSKRFWILGHMRPGIRTACQNDPQGYTTTADSNCHHVGAKIKDYLHRFIAVAVSRPGASNADVEDPANGFSTFVLVDDYGDWSQFMVRNGMVLANERANTNNKLYVWGAHDLTDGLLADQTLFPQPSAKYDSSNFDGKAVDWVHNKTVSVQLNVPMMFVRQQSDDKVTYLVSGTGDGKLVVYGLTQELGSTGQMPAPTLIMPAAVDLPKAMPSPQKSSAAYANGFLYWGWAEKDPKDSNRNFIRTFRWEVHLASHSWGNIHPIFISNSAQSKYLEADIGAADKDNSYVLPTMNVTPKGDILTMFHRFPKSDVTAGAYVADVDYSVLPSGANAYDTPYVLKTGTGAGAANPPHKGGVLDIVGVAADPLISGQLFLGNASTNGTGYTSFFAAVKP
jgi:hypothetical protein